MQTWNNPNIDKTRWPDGPWQTEPDKMQWIDEETGLDCLIVRAGSLGSLCGYVGAPPQHPLYGWDYYDTDQLFSVHGGLTFSDKCDPGENPGEGICHDPAIGAHADVWWFGFDCAHHQDFIPGMHIAVRVCRNTVYRDVDYVRDQCRRLAAQLAKVTVAPAPTLLEAPDSDD